MLDGEIVFTGECSKNTAEKPAAGVARIEYECAVHQSDHGADVLAELSEQVGSIGEHARVTRCHLERLPSKLDSLAAVLLRLLGPAVKHASQVTMRRPRKCRPVMPIDRDCPVEQSQSLEHTLFRDWVESSKRAQVEIISAEIGRGPHGGTADLGLFQCRLDDAGNADSNPVLKLEDFF